MKCAEKKADLCFYSALHVSHRKGIIIGARSRKLLSVFHLPVTNPKANCYCTRHYQYIHMLLHGKTVSSKRNTKLYPCYCLRRHSCLSHTLVSKSLPVPYVFSSFSGRKCSEEMTFYYGKWKSSD